MQGSRFAVNEKHHTECFISHGTLGALSMHDLRAKRDCPTSASTHKNMRWYTSGSDHSASSILFIVMTQYTGWTQAEKHHTLKEKSVKTRGVWMTSDLAACIDGNQSQSIWRPPHCA